MNKSLFRDKSIKQVSSPEQLNDFIRVSNPSIWILLAAVVIFLIGVCVWGVLGHLDTVLSTVAVSQNGEIIAYVNEDDVVRLTTGMEVQTNDTALIVAEISQTPVCVDETFSEYVCHVGGLHEGQWVRPVILQGELPDGVYQIQIVVDSVAPLSFVLN